MKAGADTSAQDAAGDTAFHEACRMTASLVESCFTRRVLGAGVSTSFNKLLNYLHVAEDTGHMKRCLGVFISAQSFTSGGTGGIKR